MTLSSTRSVRVVLLVGAVLLLGCRDRTSVPPQPEGDEQTEPTPEPEPLDCGPTGDRFVDWNWVPGDARLVVVVDRESADLEAALTRLRTLGEQAAAVGLPIRAKLALDRLGMQSQMLALSLGRLGLEPAEWAELHGPGSEIAWTWPTRCPPERLDARVLARWGVMLRANLDAKLGPGDPQHFPFDVVIIADRVVLTPLGQGSTLLGWLRTAEGDSLHGPSGPDSGPGSKLADLAHAPVRAVIQGESLLTGDDPAVQGSGPTHTRTLRVDADQIELDGVIWAP